MNPEDEKRDKILRFLYERHKTARSIQKILIGIRELQSEMKRRHNMSQSDVASNLDYLIQVGWVKQEVQQRSFTTKRQMELSRPQVKYKISDIGINHLEAGTIFRRQDSATRINITNIQGVTVIGDGNIVNTQYTDLARILDEVDQAVARSAELTEEQRLDAASDVATIRAQLAKQQPNKTIIRAAWESLKGIATVEGVLAAVQRAEPLFRQVLL